MQVCHKYRINDIVRYILMCTRDMCNRLSSFKSTLSVLCTIHVILRRPARLFFATFFGRFWGIGPMEHIERSIKMAKKKQAGLRGEKILQGEKWWMYQVVKCTAPVV